MTFHTYSNFTTQHFNKNKDRDKKITAKGAGLR